MSCGILAFVSACFPLGPGYPPSRSTHGLCRAALSDSTRKEIRGRRPSLQCSATSDCSVVTSLPPTPAIPAPPFLPHPWLPSHQSCSSPSLTRGKRHRGSSQSPRQRLTFSSGQYHPSQVSAPFAPSAASHHGSSSCTNLTEHAACRTTRT